MRELQDTTANSTVQCKLDSSDIKGDLAPYDCEAKATVQPDEVSSDGNYQFSDDNGNPVTLETGDKGIEVSDSVEKEAENLQLQNSTTSSFVIFENVANKVDDNGKTFHLIGTLTGTDRNKIAQQNFIDVTFYQEGTNIPITIQCSSNKNPDIFELTCEAPHNFNAKLSEATAKVGDTSLSFSAATDESNNLSITKAGNANGNVYYRKNSSGLSSGAIVAIIIVCAVALILITILALYFKSKPTLNNNSSIAELRSSVNFQE